MLIASGTFEGANGHEMRGQFRVEQRDDGVYLITEDDFYFDGAAPAPAWAFGDAEGSLLPDSIFKVLEPNTEIKGAQEIPIQDDVGVEKAEAIVTWCTEVNVLLGIGQMEFA